MKTYIVEYLTNYGKEFMIINSEDECQAKKYAERNGAWDNMSINEIHLDHQGMLYDSR